MKVFNFSVKSMHYGSKCLESAKKSCNQSLAPLHIVVPFFMIVTALTFSCQLKSKPKADSIESRIDSVLNLMTLQEKVGQMNQLKRNRNNPDNPIVEMEGKFTMEEEIRRGNAGSVNKAFLLEEKMEFQRIAVEESRLGIPLIISTDLTHGYKTIFPVQLAQAASWDMEEIEKASRVGAIETTAAGASWGFTPVLDVCRDPRWGRVVEGPGEDPYLGSRIAEAMIKGYQGDDLSADNTLAACMKHFAGYGAAESGKDYNTVTISERVMRKVYLPPFKAGVDAGAQTVMNAFNDFNGIPITASKFLMRKILKEEWGFDGFLISDYNSIEELIPHGVAANQKEATKQAVEAGVDMDMMSFNYIHHLAGLVKEGVVKEEIIDDAVRRILRVKFRLGLFDDPYRYFDKEKMERLLLHPVHRQAARDMAKKSFVLLKNDDQVLPIPKETRSIALIGPHADTKRELMASWPSRGEAKDVISFYAGLKNRLGDQVKLDTALGCDFTRPASDAQINNAISMAKSADYVILALGEPHWMSGEGSGRADISLPGDQLKLAKAIHKLNKPTVVVLMNGRPLTINWLDENMPAILEAWFPGTEGGNALADVLFGDYNPSGKLPISFPYHVGQIPVYYSYKSTGRPNNVKYQDIPNSPLYPFGHGLSYTTFDISPPGLDKEIMAMEDTLKVTATVKNTGQYAGAEVVQLYIRDLVASVTRPVKELKGFQKVYLQPGEEKEVVFTLSKDDLKYLDQDFKYVTDPGQFKVFIGANSQDLQEAEFELK